MTEAEAMWIYADARRHAGLSPLPAKRMREIARAKVALAKELGKKPKKTRRRNSYTDSTNTVLRVTLPAPAKPTAQSVVDRLEDEAYAADPTLFWLWPQRWSVPMHRASQRFDWFWMHCPRHPLSN